MTYTIDLDAIEEAQLAAAARERGLAPATLLKQWVTAHLPQYAEQTLAEILAPVHAYSREQGMTEKEIGAFVDDEVADYRAERRARREVSAHE